MTDRELFRRALEALEAGLYPEHPWVQRAITALRDRLSRCDDCGEVNPADIHTCSPQRLAQPEQCRSDGRCQYAIDHGAEGLGHCPPGKCCMPAQPGPTAQEARNAASNLALMKRMFPQPEQPEFDDALQSAAMTQTAPKLAQPEQKRPQNCGTNYCSCIECVMEQEQSPLDRMAENARELGLDYEPEQGPVAWRDHVEQRLLTWRQSFVNRSGDQLALDDFMDKESLDDLIDYVCDEYTTPPRREWVGLTLDDMEELAVSKEWLAGTRWAEAKLKEKNDA